MQDGVCAALRRYRVDSASSSEVVEKITEEFMPVVKGYPGILEYYVLDAQDGAFATVTICEDQAALEASNTLANEWARRFIATRVLHQESIRAFSVEVEDPLQGPLYYYAGVSKKTPTSQAATRMLSVREVCEELGMGKSWVYQRIHSGEIPSVKLGGTVKVKREDLEGYLDKHRYHQEAPDVEEEPLVSSS